MSADRAPLLPALDVGLTIEDDGSRLPTVVVDASGAPEVADLARVHATDGIGDVHTEAIRVPVADGEILVLGISLTTPVRAAFAVSFDAAAHRPFLEEVADAGQLVIATTDPETAASDRPLWLAVDLDPVTLRAALA